MPTLSRPLFPVGFKPPPEPLPSPYKMLPWTNEFFCQQQGLAKVGEGFDGGFRPDFYNNLTKAQRARFGPAQLQSSKTFLLEAQARHRQEESTYMLRLTQAVGCTGFREQMNVLLTRKGGILDVVWDAMVQKRATPTDALRDARKNAVRVLSFSQVLLSICHPQKEDGYEFREDNMTTVLKSDPYYQNARCHLARALFGEESVNEDSGTIKEKYHTALHALFTRTWDTKKAQLRSAIKRRGQLPELYHEALQGTHKVSSQCTPTLDLLIAAAVAKPTAQRLMAASKALSNWRGIADVTGEVDSDSFKARQGQLDSLWNSLGRSTDSKGTGM
jgi:hypothetical protein